MLWPWHKCYINDAILNCESALNLNISVAKYLSTIVINIMLLLLFLENSENYSKFKDWVNCSIHPKFTFAFSALALGLWPWPIP